VATKSVTEMSTASFNVLISQIKRLGKLTNDAIQRGAVFAVWQSLEYRNSTPADNLPQAMPAGSRRQALVAFFETYGNLCYAKSTKKIEFFDVEDLTGVSPLDFDEERLMKTPWHGMVKEADISSAWDVKEQLDKLLTKLEKAVQGNTREVLNADILDKVRDVLREAL
jgi:hypothetical protein